jgi:PKD repeat protein
MGFVAGLLVLPLLTAPGQAPPSDVHVWVYAFRAVDSLDPASAPEMYYYVGVGDGGLWTWTGQNRLAQGSEPLVNGYHTFTVSSDTVGVAIVLCDDDDFTADDSADLSASPGGGAEDNGCAVSGAPPPYAYSGTWDRVAATVSGDATTVEQGLYRSDGEGDGSSAADENDAAVWFQVTASPIRFHADAGPDRVVLAGDVVPFSANASTAFEGSTLERFEWDFENDDTLDATGMAVTHGFPSRGMYQTRLRVTDSFGRVAEALLQVTVQNRPPMAGFDVAPPEAGAVAAFTDTSSDADGTVVTWAWDFGDGESSTERNPRHIYARPGLYQVSLLVTDNQGATDETQRGVLVEDPLLVRLAPFLIGGLALAALAYLAVRGYARRRRQDHEEEEGDRLPPDL